MIVPIHPPLEGAAADRFLALARSLTNARQRNSESDLRALMDEELRWASARCAEEARLSHKKTDGNGSTIRVPKILA